MIRRRVQIENRLGLHARAAARLVDLASGFQAEIFLSRWGEDQRVNGKSILGVLLLAASQGTRLEIVAEGEDEELAVSAIEDLIRDKFGERQ